eukprot:TRINITY_DN577_c0_g1_i1.p1 TRINITY_DN577_c0_g1~~TRINITY_DN577_c0_g1_i1.p1  ORF type:complete len:474 (-),score=112.71 TRINITY_DN577_c0_g1_i1:143-1564(-)
MAATMTSSNGNQKAGFIYKEGAQFLNWKKRYLVIEKDRIAYYTRENKKDKKGELLIKNIVRVVPEKGLYKGRSFVFGIHTTVNRTYYIQGSDDENMNSWIAAISALIQQDPALTSSNGAPTSLGGGGSEKGDKQDKKMTTEDFKQLKVIGRGGFGRVLLVQKKDSGQVYAMKVLKKAVIAARGEIEHTRTERSVLSKLDHPFLAKLHWSFQSEENLYFIMDFINGGELFHHLAIEKRFTEERAKFYAAEIVSGMEYLHNAGVIYRDLKPENLLLNHQGHIVMTDFGLSKEGLHTDDARTATFCGTPEYLAPEIIKGDEYTKAIDWWSVGTLIYEMLTGLPPFYTEDEENMYHKIMTAEIDFSKHHFSPEAQDIIRRFLNRDPVSRLQEPDQIKQHPWFKDIDWDKLESLEIPPPFVPEVKSADDVRHIDDEFLRENVHEEEDEDQPKAPVKKDDFINFTFAAESGAAGGAGAH